MIPVSSEYRYFDRMYSTWYFEEKLHNEGGGETKLVGIIFLKGGLHVKRSHMLM
jgi:hypothetical protein